MSSIRTQARRAGLLYFVACITAPFALIFVPRALIVPGDATATADHVRASEILLRIGIATELFSATLFIFAVLAFYRLFKGVNEKHALAMATLALISVPISFLNVLNEIAALILVSGASFLSVFEKSQLDALTLMFLRLHIHGLIIVGIFWGLWLFPLGILVMRSGFIPRVLGVPLFFAGAGYLITSFTSLLLPQYARPVSLFAAVLAFGELPIIVWLLIWGAKEQPSERAHLRQPVIP